MSFRRANKEEHSIPDRPPDSRQESTERDDSAGRIAALHRELGNQAVQSVAENGGLGEQASVVQRSPSGRGEETTADDDSVGRADRLRDEDGERLAPVQLSGSTAPDLKETVQSVARWGTQGRGESLPHRGTLKDHVDDGTLAEISVHTDERAQRATTALGATAYTMGDDIAFRSTPDEETTAHEVAHVVQQRRGASPPGGVGRESDRFEQEADRFADQVTNGGDAASADRPIDRTITGKLGSPGAVQFKKTEGTTTKTEKKTTNADGTPTKRDLQNKAAKLKGGTVKGKSTMFDAKFSITPKLVMDVFGYESPTTGEGMAKSAPAPGTKKYGESESQAFIGGVDPEDIKQGSLGDCYFLAAMAAIARERPEMIRNMISKVSGENAYHVTLYPEWIGELNAQKTVKVTPEFPATAGAPMTPAPGTSVSPSYAQPGQGTSESGVLSAILNVYSKWTSKGTSTKSSKQSGGSAGSDKTELWPMLMEKAYAKVEGGSYQSIEGGDESESMEDLGANYVQKFDPVRKSPNDVLSTIQSNLDREDRVVGCDTPANAGNRGNQVPGSPVNVSQLYNNMNSLHFKHAYSVRGVDTSAQTVDVDNPHGSGTAHDLTGMPIRQFMACFDEVHIASIPTGIKIPQMRAL